MRKCWPSLLHSVEFSVGLGRLCVNRTSFFFFGSNCRAKSGHLVLPFQIRHRFTHSYRGGDNMIQTSGVLRRFGGLPAIWQAGWFWPQSCCTGQQSLSLSWKDMHSLNNVRHTALLNTSVLVVFLLFLQTRYNSIVNTSKRLIKHCDEKNQRVSEREGKCKALDLISAKCLINKLWETSS